MLVIYRVCFVSHVNVDTHGITSVQTYGIVPRLRLRHVVMQNKNMTPIRPVYRPIYNNKLK